MPTITVDVDLDYFDDQDLLEECRVRGLSVLPLPLPMRLLRSWL